MILCWVSALCNSCTKVQTFRKNILTSYSVSQMVKVDADVIRTENFVRQSQKPKAVTEDMIDPSECVESVWLNYINWLHIHTHTHTHRYIFRAFLSMSKNLPPPPYPLNGTMLFLALISKPQTCIYFSKLQFKIIVSSATAVSTSWMSTIRFSAEGNICLSVTAPWPDRFWRPHNSLYIRYIGRYFADSKGWDVQPTTHFHTTPRLKINETLHVLPTHLHEVVFN